MPVRSMIYDALAYVDQVKRIAEKHKEKREWKELQKGEYLSGFHKGDKLFPVVTIVVYFGAEKWDGPIRLHDILEVTDPKILSMVNDYQMHLITPEGLTESEFEKFHTNLKEVLMFIKCSKDKKKMDELIRNSDISSNLDQDAVKVLEECAKINFKLQEGEEVNMCQAWDDWRQEGVEEGIEKGAKVLIETCQEFGLSQKAVAEKIVQKFAVEVEVAERYITQYWIA